MTLMNKDGLFAALILNTQKRQSGKITIDIPNTKKQNSSCLLIKNIFAKISSDKKFICDLDIKNANPTLNSYDKKYLNPITSSSSIKISEEIELIASKHLSMNDSLPILEQEATTNNLSEQVPACSKEDSSSLAYIKSGMNGERGSIEIETGKMIKYLCDIQFGLKHGELRVRHIKNLQEMLSSKRQQFDSPDVQDGIDKVLSTAKRILKDKDE